MEKHAIDRYFTTQLWLVKMTSDKKTPFYLTSFQRELFGCIKSLSKKRECTASDQYFASIFNVSVKHVNTSIARLRDIGIINVLNSYKKRKIKVNIEKDGTLCAIGESHIWFVNLTGIMKVRKAEFDKLPNDFYLLPREKDGLIKLP